MFSHLILIALLDGYGVYGTVTLGVYRAINFLPSPFSFICIPFFIATVEPWRERCCERCPPLDFLFPTLPYILTTPANFILWTLLAIWTIFHPLLLPIPRANSFLLLLAPVSSSPHTEPEIIPILFASPYSTIPIQIVELPTHGIAIERGIERLATAHSVREKLLRKRLITGR